MTAARGRDDIAETGWVVVVQEPQDAAFLPPARLRGQLVRAGLFGRIVVLAVVVGSVMIQPRAGEMPAHPFGTSSEKGQQRVDAVDPRRSGPLSGC